MNTLCFQVKLVHDWKPEEKNSMRRLFEHVVRNKPILVSALRECQATLVMRAQERQNYDWEALASFDMELVRMTDSGEMDAAILKMEEMLILSVNDLWPECNVPSYLQFIKEREPSH